MINPLETVAVRTIDCTMMQSLDDLLAASKWAGALLPDQLERARAAIVVRELQPGNYVCHKDDPADVWAGVIDGLVKAESLSGSGKSVTFATLPANSWFGEGSILKREARKYDVVALRESHVALMPEATFFWLLDTSIPFNRFILTQLNERLGQFMGAFEHDRLDEPEARVAHTIADMLHPQLYPSREGRIEISNEELGHLVGASRQRISQALQVLEKSGLIKMAYRMITVLDIDGLRGFGG
jgi:CRP/FNR family cyclic AMP-dependent transcriptional regulator